MVKKITVVVALIIVSLIGGYIIGLDDVSVIVDVETGVSDIKNAVESVDCIFVGTVTEADTLIFNEKQKSEISVKKVRDIKGDIPEELVVYKNGGSFINGKTVKYVVSEESFTKIPESGKQYVFFGFIQNDGEIYLSDYYGNIEYTGEEQVSEIAQYVVQ